ncbi:metallophosphoesterase domain-containing protein 1 [Epithele typhae]|uniref:metallophosphoesterase domain-containing protein 1 n=1 Tax=Epithele typhae TaxID=378194 RepID=UPI002007BD07|nr:metallophosphoesterase domain-containing protein 1 [Epithele typhae]KAH9927508.1 metallophosphoesterase domain-containing protein 1 [Epithele typhae]
MYPSSRPFSKAYVWTVNRVRRFIEDTAPKRPEWTKSLSVDPRQLLYEIARTAYDACNLPAHTQDAVHYEDTDLVRVVCVSDTHCQQETHPFLPSGDILIHAGDLTTTGTDEQLHSALSWLHSMPHQHKIFIAGNHDLGLSIPHKRNEILAHYPNLIYLENSSCILPVRDRLVSVFGSPLTRNCGPGSVFQYYSWEAEEIWRDAIPPFTDILVTHGPPAYFRTGWTRFRREGGCEGLLKALWTARPTLHVFGHVHHGRGVSTLRYGTVQKAYESVFTGVRGLDALVLLIWASLAATVRKEADVQPGMHTRVVNAAWFERSRGGIVIDMHIPRRL